MEARYFTGS